MLLVCRWFSFNSFLCGCVVWPFLSFPYVAGFMSVFVVRCARYWFVAGLLYFMPMCCLFEFAYHFPPWQVSFLCWLFVAHILAFSLVALLRGCVVLCF